MKTLNNYFNEERTRANGDIHEHIEYLSKLSEECDSIVEIGVRQVVSSWAFLNGLVNSKEKNKKSMVCVDIKTPEEQNAGSRISDFRRICSENNVSFEFKRESSLEMAPIAADLLFIDTIHNYEFLSVELTRHGPFAKKYIAMHDTEICKTVGHEGGGGMWKAVEEFLEANKEWELFEHRANNNGMTILRRR